MKRSLIHTLICLLVIASVGSAQYISRYERPISTPAFFVLQPDTLSKRFLNEDSLIAAQIGVVDTTMLPPKSTTIAMVGSMLLPGAGQIYNESYWKAPVVWGFGYYFYSVYRRQDALYKENRTLYEFSLTALDTASSPGITDLLTDDVKTYKGLRDFYKNQRNEFGWYLAITYILNIVDAYVDAALFNFEVSPNLQGTSDWRMQVRVPLRR
jgi:hypothetical protein